MGPSSVAAKRRSGRAEMRWALGLLAVWCMLEACHAQSTAATATQGTPAPSPCPTPSLKSMGTFQVMDYVVVAPPPPVTTAPTSPTAAPTGAPTTGAPTTGAPTTGAPTTGAPVGRRLLSEMDSSSEFDEY